MHQASGVRHNSREGLMKLSAGTGAGPDQVLRALHVPSAPQAYRRTMLLGFLCQQKTSWTLPQPLPRPVRSWTFCVSRRRQGLPLVSLGLRARLRNLWLSLAHPPPPQDQAFGGTGVSQHVMQHGQCVQSVPLRSLQPSPEAMRGAAAMLAGTTSWDNPTISHPFQLGTNLPAQ